MLHDLIFWEITLIAEEKQVLYNKKAIRFEIVVLK